MHPDVSVEWRTLKVSGSGAFRFPLGLLHNLDLAILSTSCRSYLDVCFCYEEIGYISTKFTQEVICRKADAVSFLMSFQMHIIEQTRVPQLRPQLLFKNGVSQ